MKNTVIKIEVEGFKPWVIDFCGLEQPQIEILVLPNAAVALARFAGQDGWQAVVLEALPESL